MSVVIRLRKPGKAVKGRRHYKIVVDENRTKIDGSFIDELGFYDPSKKPMLLKLNVERYDQWLQKGAIPSDTVATLAKRFRKSSQEV